MSEVGFDKTELIELCWQQQVGELSPEGADRLEHLVASNPAACDLYLCYFGLCANLEWSEAGEAQRFDHLVDNAMVDVAPLPAAPSIADFSGSTWHGSVGYFSSGWPVAYLVAAVVLGVGLLVGTLVHVSQPKQIATQATPLPAPPSTIHDPLPTTHLIVGRITGMVDCRWADAQTEAFNGAYVPLGRKYALSSGLMEITYDTGAKVILQGAVTYEVESVAGGFLSAGKLTARVEKKATSLPSPSGRGAGGEGSEKNQELSDSRSSFLIPHSYFAVRTPTATVTDLGTEFGVEVDKQGATETRVFLGKVRVEGRAQTGNSPGQTLSAGQAARVDAHATAVDVCEISQQQFVRKIPAPVATPSRELIGQIDYSDTWTANSPIRAGSCLLLQQDPEALRVEDCHGNPPRSWEFSTLSYVTTWPSDNSPVPWPGFQVNGSKSGFAEIGDYLFCAMGFEYGLRDDFVVQFDAVQTDEWINITIGDKPATISGAQSLSVLFGAVGGLYEIELHTTSKGGIDTGLKSNVAMPYQWHNYAVRFKLREKKLTVWVDRQERGTIDLAAIHQGMDAGRSWADLPWTNRYVTVGGYSGHKNIRVWTDNFCVGAPRDADTSPQPADSPLKPVED